MIDISGINNMTQQNSIVAAIFYVLVVVGQWKVFEKAGEEGWKSIIPIYNAYILWKIAGKNFIKTFLIVMALIVAAIILSAVSITNSSGALAAISGLLWLVMAVYLLVVSCGVCDNLSKAFGHGIGFAIGLLLMQPIFLVILGFNNDQYQGVANKE